MKQATDAVLEALAVTAELCGFPITPAAATVLAADIAAFPEAQVLGSLRRCRFELQGRLTIAAIISRLDDGRPGPEGAFVQILRLADESLSACVTTEMLECSESARILIAEGDGVAARMAFREKYIGVVTANRSSGVQPKWTLTLGTDVAGRIDATVDAAERGAITAADGAAMVPPEHRAAFLRRIGLSVPPAEPPAAILGEVYRRVDAARALPAPVESPPTVTPRRRKRPGDLIDQPGA